MVTLFWMLLTAAGFMSAGALLWEGEWRIGGALFCVTWLWMMFPKAVAGVFRMLGRGLPGRKSAVGKT